jgi:diaminohydroxyphosphoribosylaminopyrimidine deaminase/5-amino-6-(5-phosphoribosylamino)uracil reductase
VAPLLLGAGRSAVADLDVDTIAAAVRLQVDDVTVLGDGPDRNIRFTGSLRRDED